MLETVEQLTLMLYVGLDEETLGDFLYLDLVLGEEETPIPDCAIDIEGISPETFRDTVETLLGKARKIHKESGYPIKVDTESLLEYMVENDFTDWQMNAVKSTVREFREEVL